MTTDNNNELQGSSGKEHRMQRVADNRTRVNETGNIRDLGMEHWLPADARTVNWADPELKEITRVRYISDPGFPFWDLSYCWGLMKDGERVRVQLGQGMYQVPKRNFKGHMIEAARRDGVFLKGLGFFDNISTLT